MYSLIVYKALTNPYMRIVRVADGAIMNSSTYALSTTTSWANSYTTLTKNAFIGGIPVSLPVDLIPGDYDILFYDAASPADTDVVKRGKRIAWTGIISGLPMNV